MNVALKVKEHQLENVLAILGKANDNVDIVIDITDGESERMMPGVRPGICKLQNEVEQLQEEEKEEEDEEQKEKEKKK